MRFKLTIAYDGTHYSGWQMQANAQSIQTLVQRSIETILRHPIRLTGAGRTDAGVHALGQTAHFDTTVSIEPHRLCYSSNALLPPDIRILEAERAPDFFHARYSASGKIYHYHLQPNAGDPMLRLYRTSVRGPFDRSRLEMAVRHFAGEHDFLSFANKADTGAAAHDSIRTLKRLDVVDEPGGVRLEFEANGFLYKMVRNITGTLIDVASGRISPDDIPAIFDARDRRRAGQTAPPQGLFLVQVNYSGFELPATEANICASQPALAATLTAKS